MSSSHPHSVVAGLIAAVSAAAFISLNNILTPIIYTQGGNPVTLVVLRYVGMLAVAISRSLSSDLEHNRRAVLGAAGKRFSLIIAGDVREFLLPAS